MKTNSKKKILVSTLALAMGAGLAGSISGSVAWYQYSTRTTAQLQGVSAGTTRNLQVRLGTDENHNTAGDWKQDLSVADINAFLGIGPNNNNTDDLPNALALNPVTNRTENGAKNEALGTFKGHPVYQYSSLPAVTSQTSGQDEELKYNYVILPLEFRVLDNGDDIAKDIYLVDANFLDLRADRNEQNPSHADITPALRAHFASDYTVPNPAYDSENPESQPRNTLHNYALLADTDEETVVSGALDLNKNGREDRHSFTGEDVDTGEEASLDPIVNYGGSSQTVKTLGALEVLNQASYRARNTSLQTEDKTDYTLIADDADAYAFKDKTGADVTSATALGRTIEKQDTQTYLKVTVTIWLEGWTILNNSEKINETDENAIGNSSLWSSDYIGSDFGIQLRFACEAEA